jgi:hypothetical protein
MTDDDAPTVEVAHSGEPLLDRGYKMPGYAPRHYGPDDVVVDGDWLEEEIASRDAVIAAQAAVIKTATEAIMEGRRTGTAEWSLGRAAQRRIDRLASVPSVSLDAVKAEAWNEGARHEFQTTSGGAVPREVFSANPYRSGGQS